MNIRRETLEALAEMDVLEPTPIQAEATPRLLEGKDLVGQASTGSGKTLAFSIPLVELCDPDEPIVQAVVLVPTRELAFQVGSVIEDLSRRHRLRCAFLYGGRDVSDQQTLLASGPQVVIGTPGRVIDLLYRGNLRLNEVRFVVIDEADEMLDEGFGPDVDQFLDCIMSSPQIALFSATIPDWVRSIAAHRLKDPVNVRIDEHVRPVESVEHAILEVSDGKKLEALKAVLKQEMRTAVVFCRTKDGAERLESQLGTAGLEVAGLRGNMTQPERERVMRGFRRGHPSVLVATNVAARGLDIAHIGLVINYDLPDSVELLTHRLGRTGRMGRQGEAMTMVTPRDRKRWAAMQARMGMPVAVKTVADYGTGSKDRTPVDDERRGGADVREEARGDRRAPAGERRGVRRQQPRTSARQATMPSRPVESVRGQEPGPGRGDQMARCEGCGAEVRISWVPSPRRPAYCRECRELVSVAV